MWSLIFDTGEQIVSERNVSGMCASNHWRVKALVQASIDIYPSADDAGPFCMKMFRGVPAQRRHQAFASDPGDYGRGTYWSSSEEFAQLYAGDDGQVHCQIIQLQNVLHMSPAEIKRHAREVYRTTRMEDGHEARLQGATKMAADMKASGFDGIVTFGYETPDSWGACVFGV